MTYVSIPDDNSSQRPATDEEITSLLDGMVTADGTSILSILESTQGEG